MSNTYSQLYVQLIFVVKKRRKGIKPQWEKNLYKYIGKLIYDYGQQLLEINGISDHIHLLVLYKPNCCLSDLVRKVKANSSRWINIEFQPNTKFRWQRGFSAFSVSQSKLKQTKHYIINQKNHHNKMDIKEELIQFLEFYKVEYDPEYLFD
jgi:REP element-mobilizing transposase RayT